MVNDIPKVEPFTFQAVTAFMERKELADKLNEVIDALNGIGDVPELESELDALKTQVAELEASIGDTDTNLATVESKLNQAISDLNALSSKVSGIEATQGTHTTQIQKNTADISALDTRMDTAENGIEANKNDIDTIEAKQTEHETEIQGLLREVVDGVAMSSTAHGTVQVTIKHEDGTQDTSAPIDLGLVREGGITLSTGATDRSFKLTVQLSDGSSWQTNDFVIPEGGGTEVSVTSIQIAQGTDTNMIKVRIGLSDGSFIDSNDWTVVTPAEFGTLQTTVQGQAGDITALEGRVQALEDKPSFALSPATASTLGGVKIGANINVTADGTISVTFPDAPDLSPYITKSDASSTYATKTEISDMETKTHANATFASKAEVSGIGITSSNNVLTVNGKTANAVNSVTGMVTNGNLTIGVNGVNSSPIAIPSGGGITTLPFMNLTEAQTVIEQTEMDCILQINIAESDSSTWFSFIGMRVTGGGATLFTGNGVGELEDDDGTILPLMGFAVNLSTSVMTISARYQKDGISQIKRFTKSTSLSKCLGCFMF